MHDRTDMVNNTVLDAMETKGGILLLHDRLKYTADHLDDLLKALVAAGFTFTTIDDKATFPKLNDCAAQNAPPPPPPPPCDTKTQQCPTP